MGLGSEWEVAGSRILWGSVYGVGFGVVAVVMVMKINYLGGWVRGGGNIVMRIAVVWR